MVSNSNDSSSENSDKAPSSSTESSDDPQESSPQEHESEGNGTVNKKLTKLPKDFFAKKQPSKKPPKMIETVPVDEKPSGNFYVDMQTYFKQQRKSYMGRYSLWENTYVSVMTMLREVRRENEANTELIITGIDELEKKILSSLKQFELKRNEVERFSEIPFREITKKFQRTLDLLQMQIREYILQQEVNELFSIYNQ